MSNKKTYEEWLNFFENDDISMSEDPWQVLQSVPSKFKIEELCLIAVQRWASAIEGVPKEILTEKICIAAVEQYDVISW